MEKRRIEEFMKEYQDGSEELVGVVTHQEIREWIEICSGLRRRWLNDEIGEEEMKDLADAAFVIKVAYDEGSVEGLRSGDPEEQKEAALLVAKLLEVQQAASGAVKYANPLYQSRLDGKRKEERKQELQKYDGVWSNNYRRSVGGQAWSEVLGGQPDYDLG